MPSSPPILIPANEIAGSSLLYSPAELEYNTFFKSVSLFLRVLGFDLSLAGDDWWRYDESRKDVIPKSVSQNATYIDTFQKQRVSLEECGLAKVKYKIEE